MRTAKGYRRVRDLTIHELPRRPVVFAMADGRCHNCGRALTETWQVALIDPKGPRVYANVQALCSGCTDQPASP